MSDAGQKEAKKAHPWRDNIEAITVSIIVIVLFKYFILEAYKIPTGSMQPTLMGWTPSSAAAAATGKSGGVHDRVLVDKLSFHFRDPERWEVVVFKYPLDRSKNYIKRIVGMPDEDLEIRFGDVYAGPHGGELEVLRRPRNVQLSMLLDLDTANEWRPEDGGWSAEEGVIGGERAGSIAFPRTTSGVRDAFEDGYARSLREAMSIEGTSRNSSSNGVGDLRFEARVVASADTEAVRVVLSEGRFHYTFVLPGPAADDSGIPRIEGPDGTSAAGADPWKLRAGDRVTLAVQNLDDLLQLEVNGEIVTTLEIPAVPRADNSGVRLVGVGGGASFDQVSVLRDIYYTEERYETTSWAIPEQSYVMLGDNTLDSSDGRDWSLTSFSVPTDEGPVVVRGNNRPGGGLTAGGETRPGGNPQYVQTPWGGTTAFFQDELGERWVFDLPPAEALLREAQPFVHRSMIQGRAVMVVWPLSPGRGIYRILWVR